MSTGHSHHGARFRSACISCFPCLCAGSCGGNFNVLNVHAGTLMRRLCAWYADTLCFSAFAPRVCWEIADPDNASVLSQVHSSAYVDAFIAGTISAEKMRQIGLPWSEELVKRTLIGTGSALLAARLALQYGVAVMCNGGTHHAHADHGTGKRVLALCTGEVDLQVIPFQDIRIG